MRLSLFAIAMIGSCQAFGRFALRTRVFHEGARSIPSRQCHVVGVGFTRLAAAADNNDFEPTWTYKPYVPSPVPKPQRRRFSGGWIVPKDVTFPEDRLDFSFNRSSGAGGQNVNKVNTKVDLKFNVMKADWLPLEVRERLRQQQANRINKEGILTIQSQEYRTQAQNKKAALAKLKDFVLEAYPRPKQRKMRTGLSKKGKERRKEQKRRRSVVKANRKSVNF